MSDIQFKRDATDIVKFEVDVQGASISESQARLVVEFNGGKTYLFKGKINRDGVCEVTIPKLSEDDGSGGNVTLEVIAENAFFEPWAGTFDVKSSKSVHVEGIQVTQPEKKTVTVKGLGEKKPTSSKIVRSILETYDPKSKRIRSELDDYEPTKRVKEWGRSVFKEHVDNPKARYCMMVLEERLRRRRKSQK